MKSIKYIVSALVLAFGITSCSLDTELHDQKDGGTAFSSLKDISNSLNGTYYYVGHYGFLGNYAVALGDMCSGVAAGSSSSGHFYRFSDFLFSESEDELEYVWSYGYKVITTSTNAINGAKALVDSKAVTESEKPELANYVAQLYALRALSNYYLVNFFALPYSEANKDKEGIILIKDKPTEAFAPVKRATIAEVYAQIKADIAAAEQAYEIADDEAEETPYYMTPAAVQALKARVYLATGDYATAEEAAKLSLELLDNGDGTAADVTPSNSAYVSMWGNVAVNPEDIFTIKKSDDDNLSANALNTLYGSYQCTIQNAAIALLSDDDVRGNLLRPCQGGQGISPTKYDGKAAQAVSNIPVLRKSEMSLIIAECEARIGTVAAAQEYLGYTAKRDESLIELPATSGELLQFIAEERVREFFGEGHNFFDARRMGLTVSGDKFHNWDIKNFCFPIPEYEINTGTGCTQNEGWFNNLPE